MHVSERFGLGIQGHKDICFIDVDEKRDARLYIDPYVIQALPDEFCIEARKRIESFFHEVFLACRDVDKAQLRSLLAYASEPNETNLGMKTISDYGKGNTPQKLMPLFLNFYRLVRQNPSLASDPLVMCMYIKRFAEDGMSDLITNIIRDLLHTFTENQCRYWNIPLERDSRVIGCYWDYRELKWKSLVGRGLSSGGYRVLLVPKIVVRSRYVFGIECYIRQYILKAQQEEHIQNVSPLCTVKELSDGRKVIVPPTRDELYKIEVHGTDHKEYALSYSAANIRDETLFVKDILKRINEGYGSLTNAQLDRIVYKKDTLIA